MEKELIESSEPIIVGTNFKGINETVVIVEDLCENLNRIQAVWHEMFSTFLSFENIFALNVHKNPGQFFKDKYMAESPKVKNLKALGVKEAKIPEMIELPGDIDNMRKIMVQCITISGMLQARIKHRADRLIELSENGVFSLSDKGMELITARYTYQASTKKEKVLHKKFNHLVEILNWLNDRGAHINLEETRLKHILVAGSTPRKHTDLNRTNHGGDYNIVNFSLAPHFLQSEMADAILSNISNLEE